MITKSLIKKVLLLIGIATLTSTIGGCSSDSKIKNKAQNTNTEEQVTAIPNTAQKEETGINQADDTKQSNKKWKLVWSDEFDGENETSVDKTKWALEVGNNSGWGNAELQYYTDSTNNCFQQDGNLVIKAVKENKEGFNYTSARLKTQGKFEFQYGKVEMRAKLPKGQGIWPAFWMLGSDIGTVSWPDCGEIDIMEHIGRQPDKIFGTLHGPEYHGSMGIQNSVTNTNLYEDFHTYTLEWDKDSILWYFDGKLFHKIFKDRFLSKWTWAFDKKFFILVNLAVGGNWPQNPDETTIFPQEYTIDYIRIYQE